MKALTLPLIFAACASNNHTSTLSKNTAGWISGTCMTEAADGNLVPTSISKASFIYANIGPNIEDQRSAGPQADAPSMRDIESALMLAGQGNKTGISVNAQAWQNFNSCVFHAKQGMQISCVKESELEPKIYHADVRSVIVQGGRGVGLAFYSRDDHSPVFLIEDSTAFCLLAPEQAASTLLPAAHAKGLKR